jgi:hypothetical protein
MLTRRRLNDCRRRSCFPFLLKPVNVAAMLLISCPFQKGRFDENFTEAAA